VYRHVVVHALCCCKRLVADLAGNSLLLILLLDISCARVLFYASLRVPNMGSVVVRLEVIRSQEPLATHMADVDPLS